VADAQLESELLQAPFEDLKAIATVLSTQHERTERKRSHDAHVVGGIITGLALAFLVVVGYDDGQLLRVLFSIVLRNVPEASFVLTGASGLVLLGYQAYRVEQLHPAALLAGCIVASLLLVLAAAVHPPTYSPLKFGSLDLFPWLFALLVILLLGPWFYLEARAVPRRTLLIGAAITIAGSIAIFVSVIRANPVLFWGVIGILLVAILGALALSALIKERMPPSTPIPIAPSDGAPIDPKADQSTQQQQDLSNRPIEKSANNTDSTVQVSAGLGEKEETNDQPTRAADRNREGRSG
jgi:hypothetical protein